jgi:putative nucleotidyltransferase with HDIG domain
VSPTDSGRAFYAGLLEALTEVMGSAKGYLREHGPMVAMLSTQIGSEMGLSKAECSELFFASVLSDMGMVGLAEDAWENPVPELPPEVRFRVECHPERSEARVQQIPHLSPLAPLVRHHHEWWDGSGYPDRLAADEIPLGAQIMRLADTVAALGQERPHRPPLSSDAIEEVVTSGSGTEFGPEVARCYLLLHRSGDVPGYEASAFRHKIMRAAEYLIPEEVSPLSSDQLLTIVANLIDAKDPYTGGHSRRVAALAVEVATQLGLGDHMKDTLWAGGYLHDLGKLAVPLRVLTKHGRLTEEEFDFIRAHPTDGAEILESIPSLRHLTTGARYHHERWDGSGYPEGISGDRIPMIARILAVCDSYDAMTSKRAYRDSRTHEDAMEEVERSSGAHFAPSVSEAFLSVPEDVFEAVQLNAAESMDPFVREVPSFRSPEVREASRASRTG